MSADRRVDWKTVLVHAAEIVVSYDTLVTLRQLFYRLVADLTLPNLKSYYQRLSHMTAEARSNGTFPDLLDRTSRIEQFLFFDGPAAARDYLRNLYRRDRTEGQPWTVLLGVEKDGMSAQLDQWFTDPFGVPHVALGGYASQSLVGQVRDHILGYDRPAALIYGGDFDPTGEDIDRDFVRRVGLFDKVEQVALNDDQIVDLPKSLDPEVLDKLRRDPRARRFMERHESLVELVQYELDALAPDTLRNLYREAFEAFHDPDIYDAVLAREDAEREEIAE
jgi:hypothetical protein